MTFLAPWFLIGIVAAAIPLLLHLRRSRQSKPILFSCTRFFDEEFLKATRRARVQDLLLMMLRMLLLALLALALAQPLLKSGALTGLLAAGQARRVVIVLDDSASMGQSGRFDAAKARALAVLGELSAARGDMASLVLGGYREGGPVVLFDQPTSDLDAVRRAIDGATLTDLATDLQHAIAAADNVLSHAAHGQVVVVSDLQATAFASDEVASPGPTHTIVFLACADDHTDSNVSVDAVQVGAARPMIGVPFTFRTLVTNHSDKPRTTRVHLVIGEEVVATRSVDLPPARGTIVRFIHRFAQPGWHAGRVELDPTQANDPLAVDDRRYFTVHVDQRLRVLAVNGAPSTIAHQDELFFATTALAIGRSDERGIQLSSITPSQISDETLTGHSVLVIANMPSLAEPARQAISRFVDAGGSVLITLGDRTDPSVANQWSSLMPAVLNQVVQGGGVTTIDDGHPALAGLAMAGGFSAARIDRYFSVSPIHATVLMTTEGGAPLLVEKPYGAGRVLLWTSTIDRDWNDLPLQPGYLPWLYRLLTYLAQPALDRGTFALTGDSVRIPTSVWKDTTLRIQLPDGTTAYPSPSPIGSIVLTDTQQAGVYRVLDTRRPDADPAMIFAVNLDPDESRPATLSKSDIDAAIAPDSAWAYVPPGQGASDAGLVSAHSSGIWDALLIVALAVAIGEPWLANRLSRRGRGAAAVQMLSTPMRTAA